MEQDLANSNCSDRAISLTRFTVSGRGEAGFVAGFEGFLFGMLLFVAGTLLVSYAWAVVDTSSATAQAAREGIRTFVGADSTSQAVAAADNAAASTLAEWGRNPALGAVSISGGGLERCARVTMTVSYPAPLFVLPFVGDVGHSITVASSQSELVDPYRSGLPGAAACP